MKRTQESHAQRQPTRLLIAATAKDGVRRWQRIWHQSIDPLPGNVPGQVLFSLSTHGSLSLLSLNSVQVNDSFVRTIFSQGFFTSRNGTRSLRSPIACQTAASWKFSHSILQVINVRIFSTPDDPIRHLPDVLSRLCSHIADHHSMPTQVPLASTACGEPGYPHAKSAPPPSAHR